MSSIQGVLYVVATPIGNLDDISARGIKTLLMVDAIAAEDTRKSSILLRNYGINVPCFSLHEHNERHVSTKIISKLADGMSVALISDAGTPLISDPGYVLVNEVAKQGFGIVPVPGASAIIAAMSVSGLPCDRFTFEGFLCAKPKQRLEQLNLLKNERRTMVFYESPHRIVRCVEDLISVFGCGRRAALAREITKLYESVIRGDLADLLVYLQQNDNHQKGEFVVMVGGQTISQDKSNEIDRCLRVLLQTVTVKQAVDITVQLYHEKKNVIYSRALEIDKGLAE